MRKVFSYFVLALCLIVSTQVKAGNAANEAQLRSAIEGAAVGATVDVTLSSNITLNEPIRIYAKKAEDGKTINLHMNGKIIQATKEAFELYKGTLNIDGTGTILSNPSKDCGAFMVYGYTDAATTSWSNLTIGKDVQVNATGTSTTRAAAIMITGFYDDFTHYWKESGEVTSYARFSDNEEYKTAVSTQNWASYKANTTLLDGGKIDYVTVNPEYKTTAESSGTYKGKYAWSTSEAYAYGVNIKVEGSVYGQTYGVKTNGTIRTKEENAPKVVIASTAEIACAPNESSSAAIYSSGYGSYDIEGYVHGSTGVYIKSGTVVIDGATVKSDNPNQNATVGTKVGVSAGGSAMVVESNASYAGSQAVTIKGDARIIGGGGYAIEETTTTAENTKVEQIKIESGSIVGGGVGAMYVKAGETTPEIYGGTTIEGTATIEGKTLQDLVQGGAAATEVTINGKTSIVISENAPAAPVENELSTKKVYGELLLQSVYTVHNGGILIANKIIADDNAQLIVEPGGIVIVKGNEGVVMEKASNLQIKSDNAGNMGQFVFAPNVAAGKSPMATIEYYTNAKQLSESKVYWEELASPFKDFVDWKSSDFGEYFSGSSKNTSWMFFDYENNKWEYFEDQNNPKLKAFEAFDLSNNSKNGGVTYTLWGRLQTNLGGRFDLKKGWNYLGNGYMAPMNIGTMLNSMQSAKLSSTVYRWKANQKHEAIPAREIQEGISNAIIPAMGSFCIYAYEEGQITLDYNELIWSQFESYLP